MLWACWHTRIKKDWKHSTEMFAKGPHEHPAHAIGFVPLFCEMYADSQMLTDKNIQLNAYERANDGKTDPDAGRHD